MRTTRFSIPRLSALASLLAGPLVFAQAAPPPTPKQGGACRDDIASLCPGIQPGKGAHRAVAQCLASNEDKVSPQCRAHIDEVKEKIAAARQACQPDAEKFCSGVAGGRAVMQCLNQHASELSDACKAVHARHQRPPPPAAAPASPAAPQN